MCFYCVSVINRPCEVSELMNYLRVVIRKYLLFIMLLFKSLLESYLTVLYPALPINLKGLNQCASFTTLKTLLHVYSTNIL